MDVDTLFINGRILSFGSATRVTEALAVRDGRVAAIGATADLLRHRRRDTAVIDLSGRFACPAFVDPHNHFSLTALAPVEADCRTPPLRTITEIQERLRAVAATAPPGAWIRGHGYDEEALAERRHPTRADLDEAAPDHPVVLVHWTVHRCVVNSAALDALGIGADTPDPPGGWIVRDLAGLPAGALYETASNGAQSRSIAAYAERHAAAAPGLLAANAAAYHAAGITSLGDAYVSPALLTLYERAADAGRLPLSVRPYRGSADGLFAHPSIDGTGAPRSAGLRPAGLKLFVDGGGNTTATTLVGPHADRATGRLFWSQEELDGAVEAAHVAGIPLAVHAAGDIAVERALTAMERARAAHPTHEPRLRIEHGILLDERLIGRMAAVGAALVVQPLSVYYHAERLAAAPLGAGLRLARYRDLLAAGVTLASGSDAPCYPMDPLLSVWAAVTRRTRAGAIHDGEQRLTVEEALRLVTASAARALGTDAEEGTLAPGSAADLVILSADPRAVPPDDIRRLHVEQTWRAGALVYDRGRHGAPAVTGRLPDP